MKGKYLIDASVYITLAELNATSLLFDMGRVALPDAVYREISEEPASSQVESEIDEQLLSRPNIIYWLIEANDRREVIEIAARHLGYSSIEDTYDVVGPENRRIRKFKTGDIALLSAALAIDNSIVITDDKPLRKACKPLSISVSGSIGVLIRAVEHDEIGADEAKNKLYAMDEVGARLSASLIKRAESLIEKADSS